MWQVVKVAIWSWRTKHLHWGYEKGTFWWGKLFEKQTKGGEVAAGWEQEAGAHTGKLGFKVLRN